jgi:prepilin-type N-terminal cleavage/methylation domain-containing protein
MQKERMTMRRGFSLVELSIVLVILGLLTGGILTGQNLIRAAELRSVSTDIARYQTAMRTFQGKYFAYPGDMPNASSFWGLSTNCAGADADGVCDGNGDGLINTSNVAGATSEEYQLWRMLSKAGMVEGTYTGLVSAAGSALAGENAPVSRMNNAAWRIRYMGDLSGTVTGTLLSTFALNYGNALHNMSMSGGLTVLTPAEAWAVDKKLDDGRPANGTIIVRDWDTCTPATSRTNLDVDYALDVTSTSCVVIARHVF